MGWAQLAMDAVRTFFTAEKYCRFVRRLRNKVADEVMSRGVQLPDVFDALPRDEAPRRFENESTVMRRLGLELLDNRRTRRRTPRAGGGGAADLNRRQSGPPDGRVQPGGRAAVAAARRHDW